MLNVHRLHLLAELRRLGTLGEVAASLSYSPSAVSQQLAQLEREVGVPLLERDGRRVRLTEAAHLLADRADSVVELLERTESELAAQGHALDTTLRVASFDTALLALAPPALTLLAQRHPGLGVHIAQREVEAAYAGLLAHDFDLIVGEDYPGFALPAHPGVHRDEVIADQLLLVLPEHGRWSQPASVLDLVEAPWALDPDDTSAGAWARSTLRDLGIEPRVHFEVTNPLLQARLARSGQGLALIPALVGLENLDGTRLRTLPGAHRRRLYTATRAGRAGHPAVLAFREVFARAAEDAVLDLVADPLPA